MRIAVWIFLAAAAPAQACGHHEMSLAEVLLTVFSSFYMLGVLMAWGLGLLTYGLTLGENGRHTLAYGTLSAALAAVALVASAPFYMMVPKYTGGGEGYAVPASITLAFLTVGPVWAARLIRRSDRRAGNLVRLAGSPAFPLAVGLGLLLSRTPAVALCFAPLLALFAIPTDRAAARPPDTAPRPVDSPLVLAPGHCPVCRELVRDRLQECTRCHTPHHRECLEFNGRCGIFACEPGAPDPTAKKKAAS